MLEGSRTERTRDAVGLAAVIVLYKTQPREAAAFVTLATSIARISKCPGGLHVLLYDNTPGGVDPGALPEGVQYESAGHNSGIAAAYNRALNLAHDHGCSWLLLLDQDTALPEDFLESLLQELKEYERNADVVAVVPIVQSGSVVVSPKRVWFFGLKAF